MALRLINKQEAAQLNLLPFGRKHPVRALLEQMKPGQILFIEKADFKWKRKTPNYFCLQISKKTKKKFEVLKVEGKKGWTVERIA